MHACIFRDWSFILSWQISWLLFPSNCPGEEGRQVCAGWQEEVHQERGHPGGHQGSKVPSHPSHDGGEGLGVRHAGNVLSSRWAQVVQPRYDRWCQGLFRPQVLGTPSLHCSIANSASTQSQLKGLAATLKQESPIQVLTELNIAWLQWSYEN